MFGIQWDLVLKHLQVKGGLSVDELTKDSTNWGNYNNATFRIENGEYTISNSFVSNTVDTSEYVENNKKLQNRSILTTTGASSRNCKMNIYDIAGNVGEWTLEKNNKNEYPSTGRGGDALRKRK